MKNKTKYIITFCILVVSLFAVYKLAVTPSKNKIIVTVDNNLELDKMKIEFGYYDSSSGNDFNLTKNGLQKIVYKKTSQPFETLCGENDFYLTYDNEYYTVFRHFIPNDFYDGVPKPHKYHFDLKKENEDIHLEIEIVGRDGEKRKMKLLKIENSIENFWGSQKHLTIDKDN